MISVEIANRQASLEIDESRLKEAVAAVFTEERIDEAQISLALVGDQEMRELNRRYLQHDYATDVLSFILDRSPELLEGQLIVSTETALSSSLRYGWRPKDELLLYVIHGALHLVGVDDGTPEQREEMRRRESVILDQFGLMPHWEETVE